MTMFSGARLVYKNIACYEAASEVVFLTPHSFIQLPTPEEEGVQ